MDVGLSHQKARSLNTKRSGEDVVDSGSKSVALHLISQTEMANCPFWVGLFQKGTLSPNQLFDFKASEQLFERAAQEGLSEEGPIMLSDSAASPARFMYLLPEPGHEIKRRAEWIHSLVSTIKAWSSPKVGIYLAPALVSQKLMHELLQQILREVVSETQVTDYYLQTTTHGINAILNTALKIRSEMNQNKIMTYVFH